MEGRVLYYAEHTEIDPAYRLSQHLQVLNLSSELRPISISVVLAARAKRTALEHAQLELLRNIFSSLLYARIVLKVECVSTFSAKRSEAK